MRRCLAALVLDFAELRNILQRIIPRELGVDVPWQQGYPDWPSFFQRCALREVLDVVTVWPIGGFSSNGATH